MEPKNTEKPIFKNMSFSMRPCTLRSTIRTLVTKHGGIFSREINPQVIRLTEDKSFQQGVHTDFVYRSIEEGKALNHLEFALPQYALQGVKTSVTVESDKLFSARTRYEPEEDEAIIKYVFQHNCVEGQVGSVTGNVIWKQMQLDEITLHPWQSMKDRYLKKLQHRKPQFPYQPLSMVVSNGKEVQVAVANKTADDIVPNLSCFVPNNKSRSKKITLTNNKERNKRNLLNTKNLYFKDSPLYDPNNKKSKTKTIDVADSLSIDSFSSVDTSETYEQNDNIKIQNANINSNAECSFFKNASKDYKSIVLNSQDSLITSSLDGVFSPDGKVSVNLRPTDNLAEPVSSSVIEGKGVQKKSLNTQNVEQEVQEQDVQVHEQSTCLDVCESLSSNDRSLSQPTNVLEPKHCSTTTKNISDLPTSCVSNALRNLDFTEIDDEEDDTFDKVLFENAVVESSGDNTNKVLDENHQSKNGPLLSFDTFIQDLKVAYYKNTGGLINLAISCSCHKDKVIPSSKFDEIINDDLFFQAVNYQLLLDEFVDEGNISEQEVLNIIGGMS